MATPKLYTQLRALPVRILDQFTLYLRSPFHNSHAETEALWIAIRSTYPHFEASDQEVFSAAFPEKPYDNARLRVLRSYLMQHLEQFMATLELSVDGPLQHRLWRRAAMRHGLAIHRKAPELPEGEYFDPDLTLEAFLLAQDHLRSEVQQANRGIAHEMAHVILPLDAYYLMTRLKYLCALADPTTRLQPIVRDAHIEGLLSLYEVLGMESQPMVAIYYHLLLLFLHPEQEGHLHETKRLLRVHRAKLDPHECLNLYTYLFNFLILLSRRGQTAAITDMFSLYKDMIQFDAFWGEASFAANHCRNIINVAANLGEFEWGYSFLEAYTPRLGTAWQMAVDAYCKGYLLFAQGRYGEAKRSLIHAEMLDAEYKINQQMLFGRIYYETQDASGIEAAKEALKMFLYRNKEVPQGSKESANNFMRFALRLFYLRDLPEPCKALRKLVLEMQECQQLRERIWLYKKAQDLEAGC